MVVALLLVGVSACTSNGANTAVAPAKDEAVEVAAAPAEKPPVPAEKPKPPVAPAEEPPVPAEKPKPPVKVDPEAVALKELTALLKVETQPKSREEMVTFLKDRVAKAEAFAETHQKLEAGAAALFFAARASTEFLDDHDKAIGLMKTLIERYPKSEGVAVAKYMIGNALMRKREFEGAKKVLTDLLEAHPGFPGKRQTEALLKKIALLEAPAPEFETQDLDGNAVKLSDFKGKIVLLDFYAGWCGPCRTEMPNLRTLYAKYKDRGFEILGVSLDRTLDDAKGYVKGGGIKWTCTWKEPGGWKTPAAKQYGVTSIPAVFLIGKDGKIIETGLRGPALVAKLADLFPDEETKPAPEPKEGKTKAGG